MRQIITLLFKPGRAEFSVSESRGRVLAVLLRNRLRRRGAARRLGGVVDEVRDQISAASLAYISLDGAQAATTRPANEISCLAVCLLPATGAAEAARTCHLRGASRRARPERAPTCAAWPHSRRRRATRRLRVFDITEERHRLLAAAAPAGTTSGSVRQERQALCLPVNRHAADEQRERPQHEPCGADRAGPACFEGIRIFDLSSHKPRILKGVYTDCGSHTHSADSRRRAQPTAHLRTLPRYPVQGPNCQTRFPGTSIVGP